MDVLDAASPKKFDGWFATVCSEIGGGCCVYDYRKANGGCDVKDGENDAVSGKAIQVLMMVVVLVVENKGLVVRMLGKVVGEGW